ncbi:a44a00d5-0b34-4ae3-8c96-d1446bf17c92 [Sclerotinia trifoliorum]|uniref:A44a00d5-0b34-4ae3-8c96-d1446bf17c92 n=1 Tax=Sclerotinia trifoliorum TaxID=28548 RepID=A0A8H2W1G8_9HELO|nr:a44a00d5-0b34-4ae3-8c96-d1446bf17c92 [Sclerotinia trifoliorum]
MSDHGIDSTVDEPTAYWGYGEVHDAETVEMHLLTSGFREEELPVPRVNRSLYDMGHCGGCNEWADPGVPNWKIGHLNDNNKCRQAYLEGTCEYEGVQSSRTGHLPNRPEDAPQSQSQQIHPQPQYPRVEFQTENSMKRYLLKAQRQLQPGEANATPNFSKYTEEQQYQQPAPTYQSNPPPLLLETTAHTGQPGEQYDFQQSNASFVTSYAGDTSFGSIPAPHIPLYNPDTQEWTSSHPSATGSQYQHEDTTNNRRGSTSGQHSSSSERRAGQ